MGRIKTMPNKFAWDQKHLSQKSEILRLNTICACKFYHLPTKNFWIPNWHNWRLRRVLLYFHWAIFKLTSNFQTFKYDSRTIRFNYMKFEQQFKINKSQVHTLVRGNGSSDFGFWTRQPPSPWKFGVKSGLIQKLQKLFHIVTYLKIPVEICIRFLMAKW